MSIIFGTHKRNNSSLEDYYKLKAHEPKTPWMLAVPPFAITGAILGALLKRPHAVPIGAAAGATLGTGLKFLDDQAITHARERIKHNSSNQILTNIESVQSTPTTISDKVLSYV